MTIDNFHALAELRDCYQSRFKASPLDEEIARLTRAAEDALAAMEADEPSAE